MPTNETIKCEVLSAVFSFNLKKKEKKNEQ